MVEISLTSNVRIMYGHIRLDLAIAIRKAFDVTTCKNDFVFVNVHQELSIPSVM